MKAASLAVPLVEPKGLLMVVMRDNNLVALWGREKAELWVESLVASTVAW